MKINQLFITALFAVAVVGCGQKATKQQFNIENQSFEKFVSQQSTGHFYSKNKIDTIETFLFSTIKNANINSVPDVKFWEWDSIMKWYYQCDVRLFLRCKTDTLDLGTARGLFYINNLGDVNADGIDEIALVADWIDHSNCNAFHIYTICSKKLTLLKSFAINEMLFYDMHEGDFSLEYYFAQKNGKWYYKDYDEWLFAEEEMPMQVLNLEKCR